MRVFSSPSLENRRASESHFRGETGNVFSTSVLEQRRSSDSAAREDSSHSINRSCGRQAKVGVFITDKENRSPASVSTKREGSALWLKLRETEAELEKQRSALKPLDEANSRIERQQSQIAELKAQNEKLQESLDEKNAECNNLRNRYESTDDECGLRLCRFQKKVIECLDHMSEEVAKATDRTDANTSLVSRCLGRHSGATSEQDIRYRLQCFQKKVIESLDYMNEEVARMHEVTDANTQRVNQFLETRSQSSASNDGVLHARLAAAHLVHRSVVQKLVSDIAAGSNAELEENAGKQDRSEEQDSLNRKYELLQAKMTTLIEENRSIQDESKTQKELNRVLEDERSSWQRQNHELVLTVQMLMQEKQQLEAENKHTAKVASIFEKKYEDIAGQNARQMGHINHKQKIQHTLQLKEEISELRTSLSLAQKRCFQLESGITAKQLDHLLASFGASIASHYEDGGGVHTVGKSRRSMAVRLDGTSDWKDERTKIDLQHLISLIQGVVMDCHGEAITHDLTSLFERLRIVMQQRVRKGKPQGNSHP